MNSSETLFYIEVQLGKEKQQPINCLETGDNKLLLYYIHELLIILNNSFMTYVFYPYF